MTLQEISCHCRCWLVRQLCACLLLPSAAPAPARAVYCVYTDKIRDTSRFSSPPVPRRNYYYYCISHSQTLAGSRDQQQKVLMYYTAKQTLACRLCGGRAPCHLYYYAAPASLAVIAWRQRQAKLTCLLACLPPSGKLVCWNAAPANRISKSLCFHGKNVGGCERSRRPSEIVRSPCKLPPRSCPCSMVHDG